jgi:hypothetical protein
MFRRHMRASRLKAMVHGGLQTSLMAMATGCYTGLHGFYGMGNWIHLISLVGYGDKCGQK